MLHKSDFFAFSALIQKLQLMKKSVKSLKLSKIFKNFWVLPLLFIKAHWREANPIFSKKKNFKLSEIFEKIYIGTLILRESMSKFVFTLILYQFSPSLQLFLSLYYFSRIAESIVRQILYTLHSLNILLIHAKLCIILYTYFFVINAVIFISTLNYILFL